MKKLLTVFLLLVALTALWACKDKDGAEPSIYALINGDIEGGSLSVELNSLELKDFEYQSDGQTVKAKGYALNEVLNQADIISGQNLLMITATDGVSAVIDESTAHLCYIMADGQKLNIKAPEHPAVVGIKDVKEFTVIAQEDIDIGIKIIENNSMESISYGNAKLWFFEPSGGQSVKFGNTANKYLPQKGDVGLDAIIDYQNNIVYGHNFDIVKTSQSGKLSWENGKISFEADGKSIPSIMGIAANVDTIIYDAYEIMRSELDKGNKVMFILPDGLSYGQVAHFQQHLNLLGGNYIKAASVNPAISNVALASIITGRSPFETGITERGVKKPNYDDIFDYALSKGLSARYIEGNSTLVATNIEPKLNLPDTNGFTDKNVYESAMAALGDNPDLLFVHFHGIDDVNHDFSPLSSQALDKILKIEEYIEDLMENFDGAVIIAPDHGSVGYADKDGSFKGKHGVFQPDDMFVPFYTFLKD
ncbi:MAG: alkaline phosphatase family protein [Christensenellales bacterium]|jgi:hypothetical protein